MSKIVVVLFVMSFIYSCNCNCDRKEDELLSVVVIFRHGDKTPKSEYFEVYPKNPWISPKLWNYTDLGGVTQHGKLRAYDRGKWLRKRYENFLPEQYSSRYMVVNASNSDRVLISTQLLLNGLMPPKGRDVWNSKLAWQPIPIHTKPEDQDNVLAQRARCAWVEEVNLHTYSQGSEEINEFAYLSKHTGKQITSVEQLYYLFKLLSTVDENGMALPNWAQVVLPKLKEKVEKFRDTHVYTEEIKRLLSGPFLHELLTHFDGVLKKSPTAPKMLLLGGHFRSLLNVLKVFDDYKEPPPYSAAILFELKKNCNGHLIVDINYQTAVSGKPSEIIKAMPYGVFKHQYKHIAIDRETWNRECNTWFRWLRFYRY